MVAGTTPYRNLLQENIQLTRKQPQPPHPANKDLKFEQKLRGEKTAATLHLKMAASLDLLLPFPIHQCR